MHGGRLRSFARKLRLATLRIPCILPERPRAYWFRGTSNFGDQLSPHVLRWVTGVKPIWVPPTYSGKVLATGSILEAAAEDDVVWGSGLIRSRVFRPPRDVTFLAVRGPLTRAMIHGDGDVPEVYGDPATLLPSFYMPATTQRHEIGVVPHYVDRSSVQVEDPSILLIDVRRHWQEVVDQILSCAVILSSSLHGLIVAEAYGIPASWIRITDKILGGTFKFDDYYLSTDRDRREPVDWELGIDAALGGVAPTPHFSPEPLLAAARSYYGSR